MHKVNRVEIINHSSREPIFNRYIPYGRTWLVDLTNNFDVEVSLQDDNKTLKIFLNDKVGK